MNLTDLIVNYCLLLSNDYLITIVALLLFVFSKKKDHSHLILLLLFSMIYKTILKDVFKSPVPITSPTLNFGFPSGHMNFATMFYVWLMVAYKSKRFYLLGISALTLTGWSIVHTGYHNQIDVILTPFFAIFFIILYKILFLKFRKKQILIFFMITTLLCKIISLYLIGYIKLDAIIGSYGILGFVLGTIINNKNYKNLALPIGILASFFLISETSVQFVKNSVWTLIFVAPPFLKMAIKSKNSKRKDQIKIS